MNAGYRPVDDSATTWADLTDEERREAEYRQVVDDGRCPQCGEDEMDGGRCYYCGYPENHEDGL